MIANDCSIGGVGVCRVGVGRLRVWRVVISLKMLVNVDWASLNLAAWAGLYMFDPLLSSVLIHIWRVAKWWWRKDWNIDLALSKVGCASGLSCGSSCMTRFRWIQIVHWAAPMMVSFMMSSGLVMCCSPKSFSVGVMSWLIKLDTCSQSGWVVMSHSIKRCTIFSMMLPLPLSRHSLQSSVDGSCFMTKPQVIAL